MLLLKQCFVCQGLVDTPLFIFYRPSFLLRAYYPACPSDFSFAAHPVLVFTVVILRHYDSPLRYYDKYGSRLFVGRQPPSS